MKVKKIFWILLVGTLTLFSCSKDDDSNSGNKQEVASPTNTNTPSVSPAQRPNIPELPYVETIKITKEGATTVVKFLNAKSQTKWNYFSLKEGKLLKIENPQDDKTWDIAFQRYYVRTNSGLSGKAQGGSMAIQEENFDAVTIGSITENWVTDTEELEVMPKGADGKPMPTTNKKIYAKPLVWAEYSIPIGAALAPKYNVAKNVFLIKGADGQRYKLQFTDYYGPIGTDATKPEGGGGFPSFKYSKL